jgi:hypothetical protein
VRARQQTVACEKDGRLLVPLPCTDEHYHELKESHETYEAVHDWWRDRYKVAADTLACRPKIRSMRWHQLRAHVACLIEWTLICWREGWLGSPRRNQGEATRSYQDRARRIAGRLAGFRARVNLLAPYGERADALDLGERTPPSRRPRGAPPGQGTLDIAA